MRRDGRRVLYSPEFVAGYRRALAEARADLADMSFKSACRHAELMHQLEQCRAELNELRIAVLARQEAEQIVAGLHRQRELARALGAERDPAQRLN
jgi:ABC-type lipopolysaccharide export system ATPase subunit